MVTRCKRDKSPPRMRSSLSSCQPPAYPEGREDDHHENYQPQEHQRVGSLGGFIPGCDALGRRGDPDAEPDVEMGTPRRQDHVGLPGMCVRRDCQGHGNARRFPGEDLDRGGFQHVMAYPGLVEYVTSSGESPVFFTFRGVIG